MQANHLNQIQSSWLVDMTGLSGKTPLKMIIIAYMFINLCLYVHKLFYESKISQYTLLGKHKYHLPARTTGNGIV